MKKTLGFFIFGLFTSSVAFAGATTCYKVAPGQIIDEKKFVASKYVCFERSEGANVTVKVYDERKAGGKHAPDVEYDDCVESGTTPYFNYVPQSSSIRLHRPVQLITPKVILCSDGFYIAYEEPSSAKHLTNFIIEGNLYTIAATDLVLPLAK